MFFVHFFVSDSDTYVTAESGTGVVHQAPGFGEDDFRVCMGYGIFNKGDTVVCPVDSSGCFTAEVTDFSGQYVKVMFSHYLILVLLINNSCRMLIKVLLNYSKQMAASFIKEP